MIKITKITLLKFQRIPPSTTIVVNRPLKTLGNDTGNREYPSSIPIMKRTIVHVTL